MKAVIQAVPEMGERHLSFHWMTVIRTSIELVSNKRRRMSNVSNDTRSRLINLLNEFYG